MGIQPERCSFVVETPDAVIRGMRCGAGPPVILLHGGPGCYDYFAESMVVDWLAPHFAVYSYDQRGCRDSTSAGPFTLDANIQDLDALRRWIGADRLNILGHSAGAVLGLHYAAAHPGCVDRLVMMSPAGLLQGWRPAFDETIRRRMTAEQQRRVAELDGRILRTPDSAMRAELYRQRFNAALPCYVDPSHRNAAPVMEHYNREVNVRVTATIIAAHESGAWAEGLHGFHGRACVIHGRGDPIPWRVAEDIARLLPDAAVYPLERCGHFPWLEEPDACRAALVAFLGLSR